MDGRAMRASASNTSNWARFALSALGGRRHAYFRLRGDRRFDRVGAVGGCAAVSATQDVMGRSSADVRFGSKSGHGRISDRCPLYPQKRTWFSTICDVRLVPKTDRGPKDSALIFTLNIRQTRKRHLYL